MAAIRKTPAVISSEMLLKSADFIGWFLLLEGDFDQRFWSSRVNSNNLRLINCVGKSNVINTIELVIERNQGANVAAIADKDYDKLLNRLIDLSNLVYTDKNDLETTLTCCATNGFSSIAEKVLTESTDREKRQIFETTNGIPVLEKLRLIAANYGVLRLINERLNCGVNFDDIPIRHTDFLNHSDLNQNLVNLQAEFLQRVKAAGKANFSESDLLETLDSYRLTGLYAGWDLVQGHDYLQVLAAAINSNALRYVTGFRQASEESLGRDLCLTVHSHDLMSTTMYLNLLKIGTAVGLPFFK